MFTKFIPIQRMNDSESFYIYCNGGIRAGKYKDDQWIVEPIVKDGKAVHAGFVTKKQLNSFFKTYEIMPFAFHQADWHEGNYNSSWHPILSHRTKKIFAPSDIWRNISSNLQQKRTDPRFKNSEKLSYQGIAKILDEAEDEERLCQSISLSLRSMDIAVEQISNYYNEQLVGLINRGNFPDIEYSNTMDKNLYANVHSFFAHFGSARDYLGALIACRLKLPKSADSFSRMLGKLQNDAEGRDALVKWLIKDENIGCDAKNKWAFSGWLRDATDIRNNFIHKQPYGQSFHERSGAVKTLNKDLGLYRYYRPYLLTDNSESDIFDLIINCYQNANLFFLRAAEISGYNSALRTITDDDIISSEIL